MRRKEDLMFGIEGLDSLFPHSLREETTLLIAGHPGAGKTTFATTVCYKNASKGKPCLYLSFQENKEKLYSQMSKYGMSLKELEEKKLFKFVRLPIVTGDEVIKMLSDVIGDAFKEFRPKIFVLDSATPISESLTSSVGRSIFQNFFYDLTKTIRGLVILVEELPLGMVALPNRDLEFVADVVILMKHEVMGSLLVRKMEIRKFRGAPLTIAELPFSIKEGEGLVVFAPLKLENVPPVKKERKLKVPCKALERVIPNIYPGTSILLAFPPHARSLLYEVIPIMAITILNDLGMGVISYRYSRNEILDYIRMASNYLGIPPEEGIKYLEFAMGLNPTAFSLEELMHLENSIIMKRRPDIIVFHSPEAIMMASEPQGYYRILYNQLLRLRSEGIITVRLISVINEEVFLRQSTLAETVIRVNYVKKGSSVRYSETGIEPELYVWQVGSEPKIISGNTLSECFREIRLNTKRKLSSLKKN